MTKAIRIQVHGGPNVLIWKEVEVENSGTGEVLLEQTVVVLNFVDVYHIKGLYPLDLPHTLGMEPVGVIV